jgi:hypothetical protein
MKIFIKTVGGDKFDIDIELYYSILHIKYKINEIKGIDHRMIRLIYQGFPLENDNIISNYSIKEEDTIHLIYSMIPGL